MFRSLARTLPFVFALGGCATSVINGAGGSGGEGGSGGSSGGSGGAAGGGGEATGGAGGAPACQEGETQACYTGPEDTLGVGACAAGTQTCKDGAWDGPCVGEVLPGEETCNQVDDDCNGEADEIEETCGVGECEVTVSVCLGVACVPKAPKLEVCDGADNDCDGEIDEADPNLGAACNTGLTGTCAEGGFACLPSPAGGAYLACVAVKNPTPEACNGKDDDCDGQIDEDLISVGQACTTNDFGVCAAGTTQCVSGLIECVSDVAAGAELCNGLDDDCDGQIDEGDPETGPCQTGLMGVCGQGTLHCAAGVLECTPDSLGGPETCNGSDDNCDGVVDEGNPGGGVACGCGGTTACVNGAIACQGGPTTYFFDDFSGGNALGWTLGTTWQIGAAVPSVGGTGNPDPANDASPSADNMLAGVVIGGNAPTALHDFYWLESPAFDTSSAPAVVLTFKRWLNSDYTPYMQNKVQVWNGSAWVDVWASAGAPGIMENAWSTQTYTLTAHKNAQMRVRFGYNIGSGGVFTIGSWSVDDVLVASAACP